VLTAAHCVDGGRTAAQTQVVVGDTDLDTTADPAETRAVDTGRERPVAQVWYSALIVT
jgi:hypothetical protein